MCGEMIDNLFAAIAGDNQRLANSRAGQRIELMIEDRPPADLDKAFRHGLRQRQQTRPAAGGKNDTFHGVSLRAALRTGNGLISHGLIAALT
jgi:hypothetical protein